MSSNLPLVIRNIQTLTLKMTAAASLIVASCQFSSVVWKPTRNTTHLVLVAVINITG